MEQENVKSKTERKTKKPSTKNNQVPLDLSRARLYIIDAFLSWKQDNVRRPENEAVRTGDCMFYE